MITEKKILMIDFTNYEDYPIGGFLSFARNMISSFGDQLGLIGISTADNEPVGRWFTKRIDGIDYDFFALARFSKEQTRHIIPDRLMCYFLLKYYRKKILEPGYKNVFVQRHEILPAIRNFGFKNICYRFPGLENPLAISKYPAGRYFFRYFDKMFFSGLANVQLILAAGDNSSIDDMISRSKGIISRNSVVQFPTRIDTDIFRPLDKKEARSRLNIPDSSLIVSTTGRLASLKGWKFMVDCFSVFAQSLPESLFYIIGDGEDYGKLSEYLVSKNLSGRVLLTGRKQAEEISLYLNSSDLFIMGSYKEGWSTSLSEAIACGIPSCVTDFSSAREIIREGINGFVVEDHNESFFVRGMMKAIEIKRPVFNGNILPYSAKLLKDNLLDLWKLE